MVTVKKIKVDVDFCTFQEKLSTLVCEDELAGMKRLISRVVAAGKPAKLHELWEQMHCRHKVNVEFGCPTSSWHSDRDSVIQPTSWNLMQKENSVLVVAAFLKTGSCKDLVLLGTDSKPSSIIIMIIGAIWHLTPCQRDSAPAIALEVSVVYVFSDTALGGCYESWNGPW